MLVKRLTWIELQAGQGFIAFYKPPGISASLDLDARSSEELAQGSGCQCSKCFLHSVFLANPATPSCL